MGTDLEQDPIRQIWRIKRGIEEIFKTFGELQPKQLRVLLAIAMVESGLDIQTLADDLDMSVRSVKAHIRNINRMLPLDLAEIISIEERLCVQGDTYLNVKLSEVGRILMTNSLIDNSLIR